MRGVEPGGEEGGIEWGETAPEGRGLRSLSLAGAWLGAWKKSESKKGMGLGRREEAPKRGDWS